MDPGLWNDTFLDEMRQTCDPLADEAVAAILTEVSPQQLATKVKEIQAASALGGPPPADLPGALRTYLEVSRVLPVGVDAAAVRRGESLFCTYGIASTTLLACASLPECYVMKYGAHVLMVTRFLQQGVQRRVLETAQMVMDVMSPGGLLLPDGSIGKGVRTAQRVRLMHAAIRYMIEHGLALEPGMTAWPKERGRPINQEDLAYTLMTFSYVTLRGFEQLGIRLTPPDRDAYVHSWNLAGRVMGIRPELIPADHAQAELLYHTIKDRQQGQTDAGMALQQALLQMLEALVPDETRHVPALLTRFFVGDDTANLLGIPPPTLRQRLELLLLLRLWTRIERLVGLVYARRPRSLAISERLHVHIMRRWGKMRPGGTFELPADLAQQWIAPRLPSDAAHV